MARLPDDLASRLISRMVVEYEDEEDASGDEPSLEAAFAAAYDECHDEIPDGFGSGLVIGDLADRGWLRVRRSAVHELGNDKALEGPIEIVEITVAGFIEARGSERDDGTTGDA